MNEESGEDFVFAAPGIITDATLESDEKELDESHLDPEEVDSVQIGMMEANMGKDEKSVDANCCPCSKNTESPAVAENDGKKGTCERCKTGGNPVIDRSAKREKGGGRKKNKKTVTDEGDDFLEEEIIDNFAIISFKTLEDLQKYEFDEEEKVRKIEEAIRLEEEKKRKEEEARRKEEEAKRRAELKLIKPVPSRKPKEPKNKENDLRGTEQVSNIEGIKDRIADSKVGIMGVKRSLEENEGDVTVPRKEPKTESEIRETHSVPERILSPSSNGVITSAPSSKSGKSGSPRVSNQLKIDTAQENVHPVDPGGNSWRSSNPASVGGLGLDATANNLFGLNFGQNSGFMPRPGLPQQFPFLPAGIPGIGFPPGLIMPPNMVNQLGGQTGTHNSLPPSGSSSQKPPATSSKKTGKWCAMHVRIAWDIYKQEQQKRKPVDSANKDMGTPTCSSRESVRNEGSGKTEPSQGFIPSSNLLSTDEDRDKPIALLSDSAAERHRNSSWKEKDRERSSVRPSTSGSLLNGAESSRIKFHHSTASTSSATPAALSQHHPSLAVSQTGSQTLPPPEAVTSSGLQERLKAASEMISRSPGSSSGSVRPLGQPPTPSASTGPLTLPNFAQAAMDALRQPGALALPGLDFLKPGAGFSGSPAGLNPLDPHVLARQRQQQFEMLSSGLQIQREQQERAEELLRLQAHQQAMLQRAPNGLPAQFDPGAMLERELLDRQRLRNSQQPVSLNPFSLGLPGVPMFSGAPPPTGLLPNAMLPGVDLLGRAAALPPGFPNPLAAGSLAGGLAPFGGAPPFGLGKLPTPFSNTLEQLARQKRDNEHVLNR